MSDPYFYFPDFYFPDFYFPIFISLFLFLQIIHDRGSYSFLVCGMIFGCLAFTFYALLVFFHRMYPKPCPGKAAPAPSPALGWEQEQHQPDSRDSSKMQGNVYFAAASSLFFLLCLAHKALAATAQGLLSFLLGKAGAKKSRNHRQHQLPWAVPWLKSRE